MAETKKKTFQKGIGATCNAAVADESCGNSMPNMQRFIASNPCVSFLSFALN
jgi:hypothetical protein